MIAMMPEWAFSIFTNLSVYLVLFAIGFVIVKYLQRQGEPERFDESLKARFARFFVFGKDDTPYLKIEPDEDDNPETDIHQAKEPGIENKSLIKKALKLAFCTSGLLCNYLVWGILQERIITTQYDEERFESSNFLVFCNRLLALAASYAAMRLTDNFSSQVPHFKYSFGSFSNIISSWCQLEALKYVSFPTQVIAKSSKLIPVMLVGKIIRKKSYPWHDYGVATMMAFGLTLFSLNLEAHSRSDDGKATTISGIILILGYLFFDSFTSQWQGKLFNEYDISSYRMMFGINSFSAFLTFASLLSSWELFSALGFLTRHHEAVMDIVVFSFAGAIGQIFIFYTIKSFGPLVFTMIMTTRQLASIILSCVLFSHPINASALSGVLIVFAAIASKIHFDYDRRKKPNH